MLCHLDISLSRAFSVVMVPLVESMLNSLSRSVCRSIEYLKTWFQHKVYNREHSASALYLSFICHLHFLCLVGFGVWICSAAFHVPRVAWQRRAAAICGAAAPSVWSDTINLPLWLCAEPQRAHLILKTNSVCIHFTGLSPASSGKWPGGNYESYLFLPPFFLTDTWQRWWITSAKRAHFHTPAQTGSLFIPAVCCLCYWFYTGIIVHNHSASSLGRWWGGWLISVE